MSMNLALYYAARSRLLSMKECSLGRLDLKRVH